MFAERPVRKPQSPGAKPPERRGREVPIAAADPPERGPGALRRLCNPILAWANRRDRVFRRSLLASGAFHMVCMLVFTFIPIYPREAKWEIAPIVVSLASLPEPSAKAAAKAPLPKPRVQTKKPKSKVPEKVKKNAPKLHERKKRSEKSKTTAPDTAAKESPKPLFEGETGTEAPVSWTAVREQLRVTAQVDEAAFTYEYYLQIVAGKISEVWMPPAGVTGQGDRTAAVLCFRIMRNGQVASVGIESASVVALFDRSARDAVLAAQPFPPLPPGYGGRWLTVHLRFALSEPRPAGLR